MKHVLVVAGFGLLMATFGCPPVLELGKFEGEVQTTWKPDGQMELLTDFAYVAPDGTRWAAPAKSQIDGASIPRVLWSLIGGPFEVKYRNASVVHDVACQKKNRDWRAVHKMFYNACRCAGVSEIEANLLYAAVYHFGPRWGDDEEASTRLVSTQDFERLQLLIVGEPEVKPEEIASLTAATLRRRIPDLPPSRPADDVALDRLQQAVAQRGGPGIRRSEEPQGGLEVLAHSAENRQQAERDLGRIRAAAHAGVSLDAGKLLAEMGGVTDPVRRARFAAKLVVLNREHAAIDGVDVRVKVQN